MLKILVISAAVLLLGLPHWYGHTRHMEETSVDARTRAEGPYQADLLASNASLRFYTSTAGWVSVHFPLYQAYFSPAAHGWKLGFTGRWQDAQIEPESMQSVFKEYFGHSKAQERFELVMTDVKIPQPNDQLHRKNAPFVALMNGFQSHNQIGLFLQHFEDRLHISTPEHGILRTGDDHKLAGLATAVQQAAGGNLSAITEVRFDLSFKYFPNN